MPTVVPSLPHGHGEVLTRPAYAEWIDVAERNAAAAAEWDLRIGGLPARELRDAARRETVAAAAEYSARLGVRVMDPEAESALLVLTGHQPELYHPGVWIKDFLLQRFAEENGAVPIDLVVDSDSFEAVELSAPCMTPGVSLCRHRLAAGGADTCFACAPVPSATEVAAFCDECLQTLRTLPAPAVARHFSAFGDALTSAVPDARDLGELITFARRRFEAVAGTTYLELPVTRHARSDGFRRFVVDVVGAAERFVMSYNAELAEFRRANRMRSAAQPFPDLRIDRGALELPFWALAERRREAVWVRPDSGCLVFGDDTLELPPDPDAACEALAGSHIVLAPKAVALTMFERVVVADLFIHGVGGARYDRVTDGVIRRFWSIEPPPFVVASMTMYLPLGAHIVGDAEIEAVERLINRLEHNPDQMLDEIEFDTVEERTHAEALASEKSALVREIAGEGADRKALGARIRKVNGELARVLAPLGSELHAERDRLAALRRAAGILTDRTYPFCLWSPLEVQDKAG